MTRSFGRHMITFAATAAIATAGLVGLAPTAQANAPDAGMSGTVSTMYQTNAQVVALAYSNGVVYAGGDFTAVRPNGVASGGAGTVARTYLAAFSSTTGALISSFNVTLNGKVKALNVSPNGQTLYVGGNFTTVNGTNRARIAAINLSTGTLNTTWNPQANSTVYAIASSATSVYLGGLFTLIHSTSHPYVAAVNTTTGGLQTAFTATADGIVDALALAPDGSRLLVGGDYETLAGVSQHGMGAVDPTTGAMEPWAATAASPRDMNCDAEITDIVVTGTTAVMSEAGNVPGCYDGDYAVNISDGSLLWLNNCEGGTATVEIVKGVLYRGAHNHDCAHMQGGAFGGFTGIPARQPTTVYHHLEAQNLADGSFEHWDPDTNSGNPGNYGPEAMATDGSQLFVGGDFTTVNGVGQQGIARFAPGGDTKPKTPTVAPAVDAAGNGTVTVTINAVPDIDNGTLTYSLYRDSVTTPIATATAESWPWTQPTIRFQNTGLTNGSSHKYTYTVSDGTLTTGKSPASAAVTVVGSSLASYPSTVLLSSPTMDWRLDDVASGTASDSSGNGNTGVYEGGATSTSGAVSGDAAVALDGSTGYVTSSAPTTVGSTWTESAWFNTTTIDGGDILGFSDAQTGAGTESDYTVRMDNDGQVVSWMRNTTDSNMGFLSTVLTTRSPRSYNDGHWHQVVVTYNGTAQSMYIDGVLIATTTETALAPFSGYWRAGYVDLTNANDVFGNQFFVTLGLTSPESYYFNGSIDEVATYSTALSAAQVAAQWAANSTAG
jgi:hypothetical protein